MQRGFVFCETAFTFEALSTMTGNPCVKPVVPSANGFFYWKKCAGVYWKGFLKIF
jgi:hypothetical protein